MGRRIILVLASFLLVLAGLFVYQLVTSQNQPIITEEFVPPPPPPPVQDRQESQEGAHFIDRDQTGRITREFGFEKRITATGDPETIVIGEFDIGDGIVQLSKPWVRIHDKSGRIVEILAETGTVLLDRPLAEGQIPTRGYLEDVRVFVYRSVAISAQPQTQLDSTVTRPAAEFNVVLQGRVDFDMEFSRLNCPGRVSVTAPMFVVEGYDLNLEYDQINERLQELRINRIKKLLIEAPKSLVASSSSKADELQSPPDRVVAEPPQKNRTPQISTYKFTLVDNVEIIQPGGREKMTADSIVLIADVDLDQMSPKQSEPSEAEVNQPPVESDTHTSENPPTGQSAAAPTVLDPNQAINMTCQGPLVITLLEQQMVGEVGVAGNRLEMTAKGNPVQIWRDGREVVRADEVVFDQMHKTVVMTAGEDRPVRLDWQDRQWITTNEKVIIDQDAGSAVFSGSGEFEFADDKTKGPAHFNYDDTMNFYFIPDPNADQISLKNLTPRQLEIVGGVQAEYLDNLFIAESISADFGQDPNGHYVPTTVVAKGGVTGLSLTNQVDGYQVLGDRIEGNAQDNLWKIMGEPAKVVRLGKPDKLEGPVILADLDLKRFEIVEPGTIQSQLASDIFQSSSGVPADLLVRCAKGVYETDIGRIELFDANAIIEQIDTVRKTTQVISPVITIKLTGKLKTEADDPNQNDLTSGKNLSSLRAHGGLVFIEHNEYDPNTNSLLRTMMMETQELKYDDPNQLLSASAGWIVSSDYRVARPANDKSMQPSINEALPGVLGSRGPSQVLIQFGRQMLFNQLLGDLTFDGGVVVDYQPLVNDPQAKERVFTAELADLKRLTCQKLSLTFAADVQSPGSKLAGMGNLQRVTATGKVYTETTLKDGQAHIIAGENLLYDVATEMIQMTGTFAQPVYLDGLPCSLIRWNVKDGTFTVKNIGES